MYMQFITELRREESRAATLARLEAEPVEQTNRQRDIYEFTAYTLHPSETGKRPGDPAYGITASGARVERGHAACPPDIPFGQRFYVPELGRTFVCTDRGGAIRGKRIDLYMASRAKAMEFGRRKLAVEFLD